MTHNEVLEAITKVPCLTIGKGKVGPIIGISTTPEGKRAPFLYVGILDKDMRGKLITPVDLQCLIGGVSILDRESLAVIRQWLNVVEQKFNEIEDEDKE